jgi:hypothetical protein
MFADVSQTDGRMLAFDMIFLCWSHSCRTLQCTLSTGSTIPVVERMPESA